MNNVDYRVLRRVQVREAWSGEWETEPYLEPLDSDWSAAPRFSKAKFRYRFGEIMSETSSDFIQRTQLDRLNYFVRIQTYYDELEEGDPEDEDWETLWVGVIRENTALLQGYEEEGEQILEALGLESLFETTFIETAKAYNYVLGGPNEVITIDTVPTFNQKSGRTRAMLGNRSEDPTGEADEDTYVFGNAVHVQTGYEWSNKEIVRYLMRYHAPAGITWRIEGQIDALDIVKEVVRIRGESGRATLYDALCKLIDPKRGFCWYVDARDIEGSNQVIVRIQTLVKEDVVFETQTLEANDRQVSFTVPDEFPFSHISEAMQFRRSTSSQYDRIIVQGQPVRVMASFTGDLHGSNDDKDPLDAAWEEEEEAKYKAAAGATDPESADIFRRQDRFKDVYRSFVIARYWGGTLTPPGLEVVRNCIPTVDDDGGVSFTGAVGAFWSANKVFHRDVLIQNGFDYTTSPPTRIGPEDADGEFRPLMVWIRDNNPDSPHGRTNRWLWVDKLSRPITKENIDDGSLYQSASVRPLDKQMGFHLDIEPNHYYALGHFGAAVTDIDPEFDHFDLVCTAAFTTDHRQRIVKDLADPMPETPRTLYYTVRGAEYWHCIQGTVIDVDGDGQPIRFNSLNNPLRDGLEKLQAYAALLEGWYKQKRQAIRISLRRIHQWSEPGIMWTSVEAAGWEPVDVNTVVTNIHTDFTERNNGVTIETGFDDINFVGFLARDDDEF
jgi:hypothetical protein